MLRGTYKRLNGERDDLARYRGRVVLVVNTATECGYTPQFEGLEALYRSRRGDGLVVLGFPANDFAGQEPRSDEEIATFCKANYGVSFPMFAKTHVIGRRGEPAVSLAGGGGGRAGVELQQVPARPPRARRRALRGGHRAGRAGAHAARRRAARRVVAGSVRSRTYVRVMATRIPPRIQGDCGEFSAIGWLFSHGASVFLPFEHSPDVDLVADLGGRLIRVQVKTSTVGRDGRFEVTLATRGGNQSWSGLVKNFSPAQCDYLFVHVGDGRRWFIPSEAVEGGCGICLGGPKYAAYEVEPGDTLEVMAAPRIATLAAARRGSRAVKGDRAVNAIGSAFAGSNPAPAICRRPARRRPARDRLDGSRRRVDVDGGG